MTIPETGSLIRNKVYQKASFHFQWSKNISSLQLITAEHMQSQQIQQKKRNGLSETMLLAIKY